jgi:hypothetical protein
MYTYLTLIIYLASAEVCRRMVVILLGAFTGPLSKVPGPFYARFTALPWIIENLTGNSMNVVADLFEKYGPVVRIGIFANLASKSTAADCSQHQKMFWLLRKMAFKKF